MLGAALLPALLLAAPAGGVRLESVRYQKRADAAEFVVRLSAPLSGAPAVKSIGGHLAFVLPGVRHAVARKILDAKDPLFSNAVLLARPDDVLVALQSRDEALATRARAEGSGSELRLRVYRTPEALKAADEARELERAFEPEAAKPSSKPAEAATASAPPPARAPARDLPMAPPPAAAAAPASPVRSAAESPFGSSARTFAAVGLLGLIALFAFWYLRKRRGLDRGRGRGRSPIHVLAAQPLGGGKRHLLLVEVRGENFLLGSAEGGISLLARMEPEAPAPEASSEKGGWLARFRDSLSPRRPAPSAPEPEGPTVVVDFGQKGKSRGAERSDDIAAQAAAQGPAWSVALNEALAARPDAASGAAEILRRKLAELNRV
jgi:flagellar biogenesis protein FliO